MTGKDPNGSPELYIDRRAFRDGMNSPGLPSGRLMTTLREQSATPSELT